MSLHHRPLRVLTSLAALLLSSTALSTIGHAQTRAVQATPAAAPTIIKPSEAPVPVNVVRDAERYETQIKAAFKPSKRTAAELVVAGAKVTTGPQANLRAAAELFREASL